MIGSIFAIVTLGLSLNGCDHPSKTAPIINQYKQAKCISPQWTGSVPYIIWDQTITLRNGSKVRIDGFQIPGGRVDVIYLESKDQYTAADAGDYVYPSDIRITNDILYSKTDGLPAGAGPRQTWLFSFDLVQHKLTDRVCVDRSVLPDECERPPKP